MCSWFVVGVYKTNKERVLWAKGTRESPKGNKGTREQGPREQGNKGTREQGNKGTREQGNKYCGPREQGNKGTNKEQGRVLKSSSLKAVVIKS